MKKLKMLFVIVSLFLIVGCGSPKTELDKFKSYLKRKEHYKCTQNICTRNTSEGKLISFTDSINFDEYTYEHSSNANNGLNTSKKIYNWNTKICTYENYLMGIKITASYNFNTNEYTCNSKQSNSSKREINEFIETQCNLYEIFTKEHKKGFDDLVKKSGTLYFNE